MSGKVWAGLVAAGCLAAAGGASASVVLDQASIPATGHVDLNGSGAVELDAPYAVGQTFTVGVAGVLDHVDLGIENWYQSTTGVHFDLLDSAHQVVFSQEIGLAQIPVLTSAGLDLDQELSVDVSGADIHVNVGDVYELKVTGEQTTGFGVEWRDNTSSGPIDYAGGQSFSYVQGSPDRGPLFNEVAFRTYVETVPEPASWALMLLGFGAVGASMRGRRVRLAA